MRAHSWHKMIIKGIAIFIVAVTAFGFVVMLLWNALIPQLFNGPVLGFWQALGLLLLSHILFRGWSPGRHMHRWKSNKWRQRFDEKLASMSSEEREKYKRDWECGFGCYPPDEYKKSGE